MLSKKSKLKKEVKRKFVKSKDDLATMFSPEKLALIKDLVMPLMATIRESKTEAQFATVTEGDVYLYDFESSFNVMPNFQNAAFTMPRGIATDQPLKEATPRAIVKPKDVLTELQTVPEKIDLDRLQEKIAVLNHKKDLIKSNSFSKAETIGMITRLENRKKYDAHKTFYSKFQNTTGQLIDDLLGKYKLAMKEADLFIPEFPDEAVQMMTAYTEETKKLCGKKPVFYVIAEEEDFQKKYQKRDPILLAQSPFGIYYQILGAWDKEMILLNEL